MKIVSVPYEKRWKMPYAQLLQKIFPFFIIHYTHIKGQEYVIHWISPKKVLTKQAWIGTAKDWLTLKMWQQYAELGIDVVEKIKVIFQKRHVIYKRKNLKLINPIYFLFNKKKIYHRICDILSEQTRAMNLEFVSLSDHRSDNSFIYKGQLYPLDFDDILVLVNGEKCKLEEAQNKMKIKKKA